MAYPTPLGCAAAYYPETNVLIALDHHGSGAQTPAAKAIPIRLEPSATAVALAAAAAGPLSQNKSD